MEQVILVYVDLIGVPVKVGQLWGLKEKTLFRCF